MPWMHDAEERPDNPVHFHHLGNCSCIVLGCCSWRNSTSSFPGVVPSDVPVGRLVAKVLTTAHQQTNNLRLHFTCLVMRCLDRQIVSDKLVPSVRYETR